MSLYFHHIASSVHSSGVFQSVFYYEPLNSNQKITPYEFPIQIKIKQNAIDFFYLKKDKEHPVVVNQKQHWFTLPLDQPGHTDFFLQNSRDFENTIKSKVQEYKLYYNELIPDKKFLESNISHHYVGVHEVLLCLFDELNNPLSDLRKYAPKLTSAAITNLEKSEVYILIRKKYSFFQSYYNWVESGKLENLKNNLQIHYNEYLKALTNDSYYKTISIEKLVAGQWFNHPQKELEELLEINNKCLIDHEPDVRIQNYFLKKHAVLSALKLATNKLFFPVIGSSLIASVFFAFSWTYWLINQYKFTPLLMGVGTIFFIFSMGVVITRKNFGNLIMPRIAVAMASALFLLISTQELISGQLFAEPRTLEAIIVGIFMILSFFLYSESRQHSPDFKLFHIKGLYNYKLLPILVHAFNTANILVLVTHLFFSDSLIKQSNVLKEQLFSDKIENVENIYKQYKIHREKINVARDQCMNLISLISDKEIETTTSVIDRYTNQWMLTRLTRNEKIEGALPALFTQFNSLKEELKLCDNTLKKDVLRKDSILMSSEIKGNINIDSLLFIWKNYNIQDKTNKIEYVNAEQLIKNISEDFKKLSNARNFILNLEKEYEDFLEKINEENLARFITYDEKDSFKRDFDIQIMKDTVTFISSNTDTVCSWKDNINAYNFSQADIYIIQPFRNVPEYFPESLKERRFYPRMLILQVMIIMLLGLIGQLIISDKTVTEPL